MVHHHYGNCTTVTSDCPVSLTTYGYAPNLGAEIFFSIIFGICLVAQLIMGIRWRTWSFMIAYGLGCFGEMVGHIGRIIMHGNAWSQAGFKTQICCLILAPSFLAAGIYLSLKQWTLWFGPEHSRLKPKNYLLVFILCDFFSIILQAAGGGIASAETTKLVNVGDDLIITGIAFQTFTMAICGALGIEYLIRYQKHQRSTTSLSNEQEEEKSTESDQTDAKKMKIYSIAAAIAFVTIFIRCVYRIPEMAGGWGNSRMRNEDTFLVLDAAMIAIACLALTIFHPGIYFPPMRKGKGRVFRD